MRGDNRKGSALVITMLFLVILTAAGLYAVGLSTSGIESASVADREREAMNAAEAGLYYGIDRLPFLVRERGIDLPNGARYDVTVTPAGTVPVPGYDMGWAQALFRVRSVGVPPKQARIRKTAEAEAAFGPVQSGTEPVVRDAAPYWSASVPVGSPSPYYFDPRDPSARDAFVQRHTGRKRVYLVGTADRSLRVLDVASWNPGGSGKMEESPTARGEAPLAVADIRTDKRTGSGGDAPDSGWRTIAVAAGGGVNGGYSAFDITDPESGGYPRLLWEITERQVPILGRGRSVPAIGKVLATAGRADAPGTTVERWVILVGAERGILVLEAATGRILQLISAPEMGEVAASPAIALDREGYIERTYVGDLSGNLWRASVDDSGRFDLGEKPFFSVTREEVAREIVGDCAIVPGEGAYPGLWVYFGTGNPEPRSDVRTGAIFAVHDGTFGNGEESAQRRVLGERDLTDATRFFARIQDPSAVFPALEGANSRGWYAILPSIGERVLSAPRVFYSNLFLASYRPGRNGPEEGGTGWLYGFGITPGKNLGNPALSDPVGSGGGGEKQVSPPFRVRRVGTGGVLASPVFRVGSGEAAHLTVRSRDGEVKRFRIPAPPRRKSVRYWMNARTKTRAED